MSSPGTVLAQRYRLDERIGAGAMGEVWRGTDTSLDRTVAVKIVKQDLLELPEFRERFLVEARTMARIKHRGVVGVHDYHSDPTLAFLVMEFIAGESLSHRLHRQGPVSEAPAMALVAQAADALQAAHDTGVVHRDVKPGNLLVTEEDQVVLTDFGIARTVASAPLTATGALIGTMSYLSPEQVLGKPATPQSDVYALGVVVYECLTGRRPFEGDNPFEIAMKRINDAPPALPPHVRPAVRALVDKALAIEPGQRWGSAAEFARAARQAASTGLAGRASVPAPRPLGRVGAPEGPASSAGSVSWSGPASPAGSVPVRPPAAGVAPGFPGAGQPAGPPPTMSSYPPPFQPAPPTPGGYPPPATGYPPRPPGQQNTFGLIAMILGIVGIVFSVCCALFALPLDVAAIVLGVIGVRKAADGQATNRGMALAGIICGAAGIALALLSFVLGQVADFGAM